VQDEFEDVGVAAARHGLEEVAGNDVASVLYAGFPQDCARSADHMRLVENGPKDTGMASKQIRKECAIAATDIDDAFELSEVVGRQRSISETLRAFSHCQIEERAFLCMVARYAQTSMP
jgi:hypothetical protein